MRTFFLIMLCYVSCGTVYSQNIASDSISQDTIKNDTDCYNDNFLGTWVATYGGDIYELRFEKRVLFLGIVNKYSIRIIGSIKKMHGNKVLYYGRMSDTKVLSSGAFPLFGLPKSSNVLSLFYKESGENKELGKVEFTLSDDKQTATWELRGTAELKIINIQKYERFEIPYEMIFKRKRDHKK